MVQHVPKQIRKFLAAF
ncbi:unnamed protein product [Acanthoscelides obtectus]|uniref:Uncharacterized protein n=1 Tax=Acanthoscelides obtectus TaxID=200917 RepID=A0A9P0P7K7_ACAOB|nr:unnamed protein product [Acanthoscelides obtectus]CAK1672020.1 hypothetical protein AOBTE_LOCUS28611 [Acanthoscelides obtectus]